MTVFKLQRNKIPLPKAASGRVARPLLTPEGVPLNLELARLGERASAFALDFLFLYGAIVLMALGMGFLVAAVTPTASAMAGLKFWIIFYLLFSFLARNFYFIFFEMRWQGQTPGKRLLKIKVISRGDGPLTADAIFARNMTREIELFLPLTALMTADTIAGASGWTAIFASIWLLILALFPFFNRDNLRVGDVIAGTIVVHKAAQPLLDDIADTDGVREASDIHFTTAQVDSYGIFELQKLEEILRTDAFWQKPEEQRLIAETIGKKIGWEGDEPTARTADFLTAFYRALRHRLEGQLLMGKRRADKHDQS